MFRYFYPLAWLYMYTSANINVTIVAVLGELPVEEEQMVQSATTMAEKQPTGRVVGIIRRKWRQYCGILQVNPVKGVSSLSSQVLFLYRCTK